MVKNKASVETLLINGADISFKTPDRWSAMAKITNKQLSKSGVPHVDVSTNTSLSPSTNGQMNFQKWNLDMYPTLTNAPQLSDVKTQQLGDTLFHESRHAEQWFLIAQNEAGKGKSAQDTGTIGVPDNVAAQAAAHPITQTNQMYSCSQQVNDNVYGPGSDKRNKTLKALLGLSEAVTRANKGNYILDACIFTSICWAGLCNGCCLESEP